METIVRVGIGLLFLVAGISIVKFALNNRPPIEDILFASKFSSAGGDVTVFMLMMLVGIGYCAVSWIFIVEMDWNRMDLLEAWRGPSHTAPHFPKVSA